MKEKKEQYRNGGWLNSISPDCSAPPMSLDKCSGVLVCAYRDVTVLKITNIFIQEWWVKPHFEVPIFALVATNEAMHDKTGYNNITLHP